MATKPTSPGEKYPANATEFQRRFPNNTTNTTHGLTPKECGLSGSRWGEKHLEACRVILSQPKEHLPVLEGYLQRSRGVLESSNIVSLLDTFNSKVIGKHSHQELRAKGQQLGAFYTYLADVVRVLEPPPDDREQPKRVALPRYHGNVVSWNEVVEVPSTPSEGGSAQSSQEITTRISQRGYTPSENDPDDKADHALRKKHEAITAIMATEFISAIVDLFPVPQQPGNSVEFNSAPTRYKINVGRLDCECQDDGSLIRKIKITPPGAWFTAGHPLAMLEAKAFFESWNEDEDTPILATRVLAQMTCEIIGAMARRLSANEVTNLKAKDHNIFLISVHQTTMTFIHTTIQQDYWNYVGSDTAPADVRNLPFLNLTFSAQFDISKTSARKEAAVAILSLVSFWSQNEGDEEEDGDGDDKMQETEGEENKEGESDDEGDEKEGDKTQGDNEEENLNEGDEMEEDEPEIPVRNIPSRKMIKR